jgi:hypothetical protein
MRHDFSEIELAFDSVSSQMPSMCTAYISRDDGKFYYLDDATGVYDDLPDDFETSEQYIEIPHKNDLNLGRDLVFEFINKTAPSFSDEVRTIFSRKGAYQRYKALLVRNGLLDDWFSYEQSETEAALKGWCKENSIELDSATLGSAG